MSEKPTSYEHIKHVPGYTIVCEPQEYACNYWIYSIVGTDENDNPVRWDTGNCRGADKLQDADCDIYGFVKWDGCTQWWQGPTEVLHWDAAQDIEWFSSALLAAYHWTGEFLEDF